MTRRTADHPRPAVGGILLRDEEVLLILRRAEPFAGRWSIPGGAIELGETTEAALVREVREEVGLEVEPVALVGVYDRIVEEEGRVVWHYVLADYLCRWMGGELRSATDAADARWIPLDELDRYDLTSVTRAAILRAQALRDRSEG